jgi:UDP-glucose 4-epimerase
MARILVTGATGFIGRALCDHLERKGYQVRAARRAELPLDIATTDWASALAGVDGIVHLAGIAHAGHITDPGPYRATNLDGTARLVKAASQAGVRRFVFVSSIKASDTSVTWETDPYGMSKREAERVVLTSGMESVVVRPPLVYGPGVKANFLRLMRWVDRKVPLPFGAVRNRRSLVNVWNLCDLLELSLRHPAAPGRVWMASDGEDLSTPELIRHIARAMQRPARLVHVPLGALQVLGALTGKSGEVERLCGSLEADIKPTREVLGWSPPLTVDEGLARTVEWYQSTC